MSWGYLAGVLRVSGGCHIFLDRNFFCNVARLHGCNVARLQCCKVASRVAKTRWTSQHPTKQLKTFLTFYAKIIEINLPKHSLLINFFSIKYVYMPKITTHNSRICYKGATIYKICYFFAKLSCWTQSFLSATGTVPIFLQPWLQGCQVQFYNAMSYGYKVVRLQGCKVSRLQGRRLKWCDVAMLQHCNVTMCLFNQSTSYH